MENNNNTSIKIYRDGELSRMETYLPIVKQKLINLGNKVDYFFVNNDWPH